MTTINRAVRRWTDEDGDDALVSVQPTAHNGDCGDTPDPVCFARGNYDEVIVLSIDEAERLAYVESDDQGGWVSVDALYRFVDDTVTLTVAEWDTISAAAGWCYRWFAYQEGRSDDSLQAFLSLPDDPEGQLLVQFGVAHLENIAEIVLNHQHLKEIIYP